MYVCTLCWGLLWFGVEARNRAAARCCKGRVLKRAGPTPKTASCICMSTEQDFKEEGLRTGFETWKKRETESLSRRTGRENNKDDAGVKFQVARWAGAHLDIYLPNLPRYGVPTLDKCLIIEWTNCPPSVTGFLERLERQTLAI